ncbi:MAG TPA: hypothetical protein VFT29_15915 [Gemmatimonadaceae bacterium]|nr:hypothetical protein [Gemmatimonadaceae bacterium]
MSRPVLAFALTLSLSVATPARSQAVDPAYAGACVARLPREAFIRAPVFLAAETDSANRPILRGGAMLALVAGDRIRKAFGWTGGEKELPVGDSIQDWRHTHSGFLITTSPSGRFAWRRLTDAADTVLTAADRALEHALLALADEGQRLSWPNDARSDSLSFKLTFTRSLVRKDLRIVPPEAYYPVPVFSLMTPWEQPAEMVAPPRISYPLAPRRDFREGTFIIEYVVDTTGAVDINSVRDRWPANKPRLTGERGKYYADFVQAVRNGLRHARFRPELVGGCAVRQRVVQSFNFALAP